MNNISIKVDKVSKTFNINQSRGILNLIKKNSKHTKNEKILALDKISFTVSEGEILGIIGLNGSGKTTLLRIIAGVYQPDKGEIKINGNIAPLMQLGAGFNPELNTLDNILLNGMLLGISKQEIQNKIKGILEYAELEKFSNLKLKYFSAGMRARLAFSIAIQIDSDIFLIDEILSVGDKEFQKKSYETIFSLKKRNKTVIHTTHNLKRLIEFSDRVIVLDKGKMLIDAKPEIAIQKYLELKTSL